MEQAVQDQPHDVEPALVLGREFDECAEQVVQLDGRVVAVAVGFPGVQVQPGGLAVVEDLVVQEESFVAVSSGGLRRGERELEDVFEGTLVT